METTRRNFLSGAVAAATLASSGVDASAASPARTRAGAKQILLKGGTVLTMDDAIGDFPSADVLIEGDVIKAVAPNVDAPNAQVIDAVGRIVIPGFVDTHRHAWEGQLRRVNPNSSDLNDYLAGTHFSFATKYRPVDMYIGNLLTSLGCLDAGITTIIDNSHNSRSIDHANAAVDALEKAGIRAVHAPGAPLAGEWQKNSWYDDLATLQRQRFTTPDSLVTMAMMTAPDEEEFKVGRKLGLDLVTEFFGKEMSDMLPGFQSRGALGADNIFNHCTGLTSEAWEIIKAAQVRVDVCPRSDAHWGLGAGMFGYQDAIDHGLRPGFSVDNESAYSGDMFMEMRTALYLQRSATQARRFAAEKSVPAAVGTRDLLKAATIDGARVAGLSSKTGSITVGKQADIVLINTNDINLYPSSNAYGTVVSAAERSNIETVIVGGHIRKAAGKLVDVDYRRLRADTEESRKYLFEAVGFKADPFAEKFSLEK